MIAVRSASDILFPTMINIILHKWIIEIVAFFLSASYLYKSERERERMRERERERKEREREREKENECW